jgi:VWFA-related protein
MTSQIARARQADDATLRVSVRNVLVDVVVTDKSGKPVTGLSRDAFTVTEQKTPQIVSFFEEHKNAPPAPVEIPKMPPNVFTNFSPLPAPAAVNVLLLDSLNTRMESQSFVHQQALKFLKTAKPGSRMAIFSMGLSLHFIQGFTDDPALLVAALNNKKNNEVETSVMLKSQDEDNGQQNLIGIMSQQVGAGQGGSTAPAAMIAALANFMQENDSSRTVDRVLVTLTNFQRLATFLNGFPGRKNVIWFSESFPLAVSNQINPQMSDELSKTMAMLAAARVAIYPVDSRGVSTVGFYQADSILPSAYSTPGQIMGVPSGPTVGSPSGPGGATSNGGNGGASGGPGAQMAHIQQEDMDRNSNQYTMQTIAQETGGKAFVNTNGLSELIADVTSSGSDFYTLSYSPTNSKMDGSYRTIDVKVAGGKYNLSYRRGYTATDAAVPGSASVLRSQAINKLAEQNPGSVDPLVAFMDLGMPQSEQILYKVLIQPIPAKAGDAADAKAGAKSFPVNYSVDFALDLKDLNLKKDANGLHNGTLNISLIAYDRYGKIASRKDHRVVLTVKPDVYAVYQQTGVQLHAEIGVPKGQYWLRTGVYDQSSRKVGTLETSLSEVKQTGNPSVKPEAGPGQK